MSEDPSIYEWIKRGDALFNAPSQPMFSLGVWWAERPWGKREKAMQAAIDALEEIAEGPEQWTAEGMAQIARNALRQIVG